MFCEVGVHQGMSYGLVLTLGNGFLPQQSHGISITAKFHTYS
jgi:hypothetical protein